MGGGGTLTQPAALFPLGEVLEAVGGAALCLLVLLDVPRQLGGDVGDKEAAAAQTVVVTPHPELAVLRRPTHVLGVRRLKQVMISLLCSKSDTLFFFTVPFTVTLKHLPHLSVWFSHRHPHPPSPHSSLTCRHAAICL